MKRYCGRRFSGEESGQLGALIADHPGRTRAQLSRLACRLLQWRKADGGLKEMSCRVAMLRLHREGLLQLPPPRNRKGGSSRIEHTFWSAPQPLLSRPVQELPGVHLEPVLSRPDSALWNEYIEPLSLSGIPASAGGSAALLRSLGEPPPGPAWLWRPRLENRPSRPLHRLVSFGTGEEPPTDRQPRPFLDPSLGPVPEPGLQGCWPWPRVYLPQDGHDRYAYRPVLLETFVDTQRFTGACYKAANWIHVGQTQGRGKLDRDHKADLPTKSIWLSPLSKFFRRALRST